MAFYMLQCDLLLIIAVEKYTASESVYLLIRRENSSQTVGPMSKIRISIDPKGNPKILDVSGLGQNCQEATKNFEKMLGKASEETRQLTDNHFELEPERLLQENGG